MKLNKPTFLAIGLSAMIGCAVAQSSVVTPQSPEDARKEKVAVQREQNAAAKKSKEKIPAAKEEKREKKEKAPNKTMGEF